MSNNVIDFKRPPKPKEPKKPRRPNPRLRKLLTAVAVVIAFILAWAYFQYIGG